MQMTHKHDVYFSPYSTVAHNLVMQIADYCNKRGIWYKISESTLGIGIEYGGNVAYVIDEDRKTEPQNYCDDCLYTDTCDSKEFFYACTSKATISKMEQVDKDINVRSKDEPQTGEMVTEEEFDSMLARVLTGNNEPQTERSE